MATSLQIQFPEDLLAQITQMANAEGKTVDQLIEQATTELLASKRRTRTAQAWEQLSSSGQAHAAELNLKPADVERLITEARRERRG